MEGKGEARRGASEKGEEDEMTGGWEKVNQDQRCCLVRVFVSVCRQRNEAGKMGLIGCNGRVVELRLT